MYFAIVNGNHIQFDTNTGQLEIYETEKDARRNCRGKHRIQYVVVAKDRQKIDMNEVLQRANQLLWSVTNHPCSMSPECCEDIKKLVDELGRACKAIGDKT